MRKEAKQLETFTEPKDFVDNPRYVQQRQASLAALDIDTIDAPIVNIVRTFQDRTCCFTLQSCYGHFIHAGQQDRNNTEPLPILDGVAVITYRIAYVALCIENSPEGKDLLDNLRNIPAVAPECIQFGSAEWFWSRQINSYALQVAPKRYMNKDQSIVDYREAFHIQEVRDSFFSEIRRVLHEQQRGIQRKGNV